MTELAALLPKPKQRDRAMPSGLSPSSLNSYLKCPRGWAREKVDKLPTTSGTAAVLGTHVHRVLELLMQQDPPGRTLDFAMSEHARIMGRLGEATAHLDWFGEMPAKDDEDLSHFAEVIETGWNLDEFAVQAEVGIRGYFEMSRDPNLVTVEETEAELDCVWETEHGPVPVRGIADRLDRLPENSLGGGLLVADYKNGKAPTPKQEEWDRRKGVLADNVRQMFMYAGMVESVYGELPKRAVLLYVSAQKPKQVDVTREQVDAVKEEAGRVWAEANAAFEDDSYEPKVSALCGWCDFVGICAEGEAKVRQMADKGIWDEDAGDERIRGGIKASAPALRTLGLLPSGDTPSA